MTRMIEWVQQLVIRIVQMRIRIKTQLIFLKNNVIFITACTLQIWIEVNAVSFSDPIQKKSILFADLRSDVILKSPILKSKRVSAKLTSEKSVPQKGAP